ncbi:hypothetical protein BDV98DRAFT_387739 [Pterulicium gracile]|uniref:Uncharacterized protein n=1 Tax=Pterulicium gracile TaxID=1884261 RepID=A0A5C3QQ54_9AGAR|nr:hypothetical protein BDV98DRAFT_387739 [Pterula gracilis]
MYVQAPPRFDWEFIKGGTLSKQRGPWLRGITLALVVYMRNPLETSLRKYLRTVTLIFPDSSNILAALPGWSRGSKSLYFGHTSDSDVMSNTGRWEVDTMNSRSALVSKQRPGRSSAVELSIVPVCCRPYREPEQRCVTEGAHSKERDVRP